LYPSRTCSPIAAVAWQRSESHVVAQIFAIVVPTLASDAMSRSGRPVLACSRQRGEAAPARQKRCATWRSPPPRCRWLP